MRVCAVVVLHYGSSCNFVSLRITASRKNKSHVIETMVIVRATVNYDSGSVTVIRAYGSCALTKDSKNRLPNHRGGKTKKQRTGRMQGKQKQEKAKTETLARSRRPESRTINNQNMHPQEGSRNEVHSFLEQSRYKKGKETHGKSHRLKEADPATIPSLTCRGSM